MDKSPNFDDLPPFPTLDDLKIAFHWSERTARRRVDDARRGIGSLPPPLDFGGGKRKLVWSRDSIVAAFCQSQRVQYRATVQESASKLAKEDRIAREELRRMGMKLPTR